jgi:hypothetical protein
VLLEKDLHVCLCGFLIVKYMSKGPYYGNPPPENGRVALTFDSGVAIDLVNSDDASWWEVCTNISINWTQVKVTIHQSTFCTTNMKTMKSFVMIRVD